MALFNVSVLSTLNIPRQERETLLRIAVALEAIVTKINEPDPEPPPADNQAALDALVAKLAESNVTLADEVAKILAVHPSQGA